ncbi:MAG: hypothetical protein M3P49_13165 [Actinomycetota bacterium]|nr:hypothetical protein [Actinomycetota bacterium]
MSLDVKDLAREVSTATVELPDGRGSFEVQYRPNVVTTKWVKGMRKAETEQDEAKLTGELIKLLEDWDLTTGGKKLPVNEETFDELPIWLTSAIIKAVMQAATGGVTNEEGKAA